MKKIILLSLAFLLIAIPAFAQNLFPWNTESRFLGQTHTWTGQQNFSVTTGTSTYQQTLNTPTINSDATRTSIHGSDVRFGANAAASSTYTIGVHNGQAFKIETTYDYANDTIVAFKVWDTGLKTAITIDANTKIGLYSGVSIGGVDPISGITSYIAFASGVSPAAGAGGSMTGGGIIYCMNGQLWVNGTAGDHTQITPHDPETGEIYTNTFNSYTGQGIKYYPQSGKTVLYTVPKTNPENAYRERWISEHMQTASVIVPEDQAFEQSDENVVVTDREEEKTSYAVENGKIVLKRDKVWVPVMGKRAVTRLKAGHLLDASTGLVHRKPTRAEAEAAAVTGFTFDWSRMPKFVREAWGH